MHKNVLLGGGGGWEMLEMQKDRAVMKEGSRTGEKKMVDEQMTNRGADGMRRRKNTLRKTAMKHFVGPA